MADEAIKLEGVSMEQSRRLCKITFGFKYCMLERPLGLFQITCFFSQ